MKRNQISRRKEKPNFGQTLCQLSGNKSSVQTGKTQLTSRDCSLLASARQREVEDLPSLLIEEMLISIYTKEELISDAVVEITNNNREGPGSINDPRMGSTTKKDGCRSCGGFMCSGHLGYLPLATPSFHVFYLQDVADLLTCLCPGCGMLLVDEDTVRLENAQYYKGHTRLKIFSEICSRKNQVCRGDCTESARLYVTNKKEFEIGYYKKPRKPGSKKFQINEEEALRIIRMFEQRPEEVALLGLPNPSAMILEVLPVIPQTARPDPTYNGVTRQNDLSILYHEIIGVNDSIKTIKEQVAHVIQLYINSLKDPDSFADNNPEYFWLINARDRFSKLPGAETLQERLNIIDENRSLYPEDSPLKKIKNQCEVYKAILKKTINSIFYNPDGKLMSITRQIKGKEGLIRGNIMGKRTSYSARTVANPDMSVRFGEVLVPRVMAPNLTVPVRVAPFNRNYLQALLQKGRVTRVQIGEETYIADDHLRSMLKLRDGMIVHRWLQNGDFVILNRHPTLHRFGLLGQRVKLSEDDETKVLGLHLSVTGALNADFDGDEVNIHVVQTIEEMSEIYNIASSTQCIMNDSTGRPVSSLVFDNLAAVMEITNPDLELSREEFYDLVTEAFPESFDIETHMNKINSFGISPYSGRSVFSALLPDGFRYTRGPKGNEDVVIFDGILIKGLLTKADVGSGGKSIIQRLYQSTNSSKAAADFIDRASRLLNRFMTNHPSSVGYRDCLPADTDEHDRVRKAEIAMMKRNIFALGGTRDDPEEEKRREAEIISQLNVTRDKLAKRGFEKLSPYNAFLRAINSGAKGSKFNLVQIVSMLGQQFYFGERPKFRLNYFHPGELDPEAFGFIPSSFTEGLNPYELFFHMGTSRLGVLDTATKTQETGYTQRVFTKNMENITQKIDGTVADVKGQIIQFMYGEDGFDARELVKQRTRLGGITMFIDLQAEVDDLNQKYLYL